MKKIVFSFFLAINFLSYLHAQFDAQSSQYMLNTPSFNPAAVGETGMMDITGQHRLQWLGMPNGGSTTIFNINAPITIAGKQHGLGLNFINDKIGLFVNQGVNLQYALKFNAGEGKLNLGTQLGFMSIGFRGDSVRLPQTPNGAIYHDPADPAIPTTSVEGMGFDIGFGAWYTYKKFYAGASFSHLNQPVIEWNDNYSYKLASTFYLTGGYSFSANNPKYVFQPSMLFKTDLTTFMMEVSTLLQYNNQYWGGASYRYGDAVVILAGINIGNGLSIGYSYDLPVSQIIKASWGSHEILLSYEINVQTGTASRRKKYKNIRIL
ncbi:MAG: type IX secretion system membrane protein PorP/SprF [Paludibacter sp.]|nr:type IX secretion system membrane protein PorP/SprF [Paludibacter sp.]